MAASYVTLVLDLFDGSGQPITSGYAQLVPSAVLTDVPDQQVIPPAPVTAEFRAGLSPQVTILASDSAGPQPAGWSWQVMPQVPGGLAAWSFFAPAGPVAFTAAAGQPAVFTWTAGAQAWGVQSLPDGTAVQLSGGSLPGGFAEGAMYYVVNSSGYTVQLAATAGGPALASASAGSGSLTVTQWHLSALTRVQATAAVSGYLPLPSGTAADGMVPVASGAGEASAWKALTAADVGADASGAAAAAQANAEAASVPLSDFTSLGDTLYGTGAGTVTRLGIGADGQVQGVVGGKPAWMAIPGGGSGTGTASRPVIWCDDFGDDDFALTCRILAYHAARGDVDVLGVSVECYTPDQRAAAADAMLRHDGLVTSLGMASGTYSDLGGPLNLAGSNMAGSYAHADFATVTDAATLMRTALAGSASKVDLICTGPLFSLYELLESPADGISPLTGQQLIAAKVNAVWIQGGDYPTGSEYNFDVTAGARTAAAAVVNNWNTNFPSIPVTYLGYTAGLTPGIGDTLFTDAPADDPCRQELIDFGKTSQAPWDAMLVRMACVGSAAATGWSLTQGVNSVDASTGANTFTAGAGNQYYVTKTWTDTQFYDDLEPLLILGAQPGREARPAEKAGTAVSQPSGTAYTLVVSDAGRIVETTSASAVTVTVPPSSSVPFSIGTEIGLFQAGTGALTVAAGSGVTVDAPGGLAAGGQYSVLLLRKRGPDEWVLSSLGGLPLTGGTLTGPVTVTASGESAVVMQPQTGNFGANFKLDSTLLGGGKWTIYSGAAGDAGGAGVLGFYDNSSGANAYLDANGNLVLPASGLSAGLRTVTASTTLAANDSTVLLNAATLTATLPTAAGVTGRIYTVKLIAASTATVATTSSQTIDGAATYSLSAQHKYVTVQSDGTNWQVIANN